MVPKIERRLLSVSLPHTLRSERGSRVRKFQLYITTPITISCKTLIPLLRNMYWTPRTSAGGPPTGPPYLGTSGSEGISLATQSSLRSRRRIGARSTRSVFPLENTIECGFSVPPRFLFQVASRSGQNIRRERIPLGGMYLPGVVIRNPKISPNLPRPEMLRTGRRPMRSAKVS